MGNVLYIIALILDAICVFRKRKGDCFDKTRKPHKFTLRKTNTKMEGYEPECDTGD